MPIVAAIVASDSTADRLGHPRQRESVPSRRQLIAQGLPNCELTKTDSLERFLNGSPFRQPSKQTFSIAYSWAERDGEPSRWEPRREI